MIILRATRYVTVPWKNGGGVTREILRSESEGTEFDWRLSLATVDAPGPFSTFDGYQRTLVLVSGAGVELNFVQHGTARLSAVGQAVSFDGAWQTSCTLLDGASTDLNLIVSKDRAQSASRAVQLSAAETIQTADWSELLVCCISGTIRLTNTTGGSEALHATDVARCSPADGAITCSPLACSAQPGSPPAGNPPHTLAPHVFVAGLKRRR